MIIAKSKNIKIRTMDDTEGDYELMAKWLNDKTLLEFVYGQQNPQPLKEIKRKFKPRILEKERIVPCIFSYQNQDIGFIQFYPADASEYRLEDSENVWGLDLWIGESEFWNKGIGTDVLKLISKYLFKQKSASKIVTDPHIDNLRAIKAYEKAGFRKIKILKKHEIHNYKKMDCWLMEFKAKYQYE